MTAARKSVVNILWAFLSFVATKLLSLIAIVILARFLAPAEIGLMAFCVVVMSYFEIVSRFGFGAALISSPPEETADTADTVFAMALATSCTMAAVLVATSGQIAAFFEQPEVAPMLRVLSVAVVIEALGTVNSALLQKELRFRRKIVPDTARGLVKGLSSIGLALAGFGVWSLVFGYLAGATAFSVVMWFVQPWRPRGLPRPAMMGGILRFGGSLLVGESINMLNRTMSQLMIGRMLGAAPLGLFNLAYRIPDLGIKSFTHVASTVAHPIMAEMQSDREALQRYFYGCLCYFTLFTFGGGAAIATLAEPMVVVFFTPVWYDMIVPMQLLAVAFALSTINLLPGAIYKAIRRPGYILKVSLMTLPVTVATLWLVVPMGIEAVAAAQVGLTLVYVVPNVVILRRVIGISVRTCIQSVMPALFCGVAAALGGHAGRLAVPSALGELLVGGLCAAAAYLAALAIVRPQVVAQVARRLGLRRRAVGS